MGGALQACLTRYEFEGVAACPERRSGARDLTGNSQPLPGSLGERGLREAFLDEFSVSTHASLNLCGRS